LKEKQQATVGQLVQRGQIFTAKWKTLVTIGFHPEHPAWFRETMTHWPVATAALVTHDLQAMRYCIPTLISSVQMPCTPVEWTASNGTEGHVVLYTEAMRFDIYI